MNTSNQRGTSLVAFIIFVILLFIVTVQIIKITPTVFEYLEIKKTVERIQKAGGTIPEMRMAFSKQRIAGYISSIDADDLTIKPNGETVQISFAYDKEIQLIGPVSLLIHYSNGAKELKARE